MIDYTFLEKHQNDLIEIYKKERYMNNKGQQGALILDYRKDNNVDVYYWTVDNMVPHIKNIFIEEYKKNIDNKSVAYVILFDEKDIQLKLFNL
jgi:hypothetical protein